VKSNKTKSKANKEKQPQPGVQVLEDKELLGASGTAPDTACAACLCTGA
jgi:hypothetical protein